MQFLIYVMLQMGNLSNAYKLQSSMLCMSEKESLFKYFIQQCIKNKLLRKLMMLPVTAEEEVCQNLISCKRCNIIAYYNTYMDTPNLKSRHTSPPPTPTSAATLRITCIPISLCNGKKH